MGAFGSVLGALGTVLGPSWEALGAILESCWSTFGGSEALGKRFGSDFANIAKPSKTIIPVTFFGGFDFERTSKK